MFTVTADTPALAAIHHMAADHKSCVGIVDAEGGKLVGNLSVSDLRDLPPQHFAVMLLPVGELVAILHGKVTENK